MNNLKPENEFKHSLCQTVVEHMHAFRTTLCKKLGREAGKLNPAGFLKLFATILNTLNRG